MGKKERSGGRPERPGVFEKLGSSVCWGCYRGVLALESVLLRVRTEHRSAPALQGLLSSLTVWTQPNSNREPLKVQSRGVTLLLCILALPLLLLRKV